MTIEIKDKVLGNYVPFAVLVFHPPDQLMVHLVHGAHGSIQIGDALARQLLAGVLKPEIATQIAYEDKSAS